MIRYYFGTIAAAFILLFTLSTGCNKDEPLTEELETEVSDTTWIDSTTIFGDPGDTITMADILGCTDSNADNFNPEATTDDGSCTYPVIPTGSIDDLTNALQADQSDFETFNFLAEFGGYFTTIRQTNVIFNPNSLQTPDGDLVTGQVQVDILEIYSKGDILRYGKPTISNGQILRSDGEFLVRAYQDGQELEMVEGSGYTIQSVNWNPDNEMKLFEDNGGTDEEFTWLLFDENSASVNSLWTNEWQDSLSQEEFAVGYEIFTDRLFTWLNCDAFASYPPEDLTTISIELPEEYTNQNTVAFVVFNDENTVLSLWGNPETMAFTSGTLPIGADVTIVVLTSFAEEEYQFDLISTTITPNQVIPSMPEDATLEEIEAALINL